MDTRIKLNTKDNKFEITLMNWNDLYSIMIGIETTISVIQRYIKDNPTDNTIEIKLKQFKHLYDDINKQYPNCKGKAVGLLEDILDNTLKKYNIKNC